MHQILVLYFVTIDLTLTLEEVLELNESRKLVTHTKEEVTARENKNKIKSVVWKKFHVISHASTNQLIQNWVQCTACSSFIPYHNNTTSRLKDHVCKRNENQLSMDNFVSREKETPINFLKEEIQNIREAACKFIVSDIRPFYAVEGEGLRALLRTFAQLGRKYPHISDAQIDKILPSRPTMHRHVMSINEKIKSQIQADFQKAIQTTGGFSCTLDLYTDRFRSISYLGITAKMNILEKECVIQKEYVVHLNYIKETNGVAIRTELEKIFNEYGITSEHIRNNITWISDRGGNIRNALGKNIRNALDCERINCFAHLINNIVEKMCKDDTAKSIVSQAASLVRTLKKSGLSNVQLDASLKSFCETRWNGVHLTLNSILENYDSLLDYLRNKDNDMLIKFISIPKLQMTEMAKFLGIFTDITIKIQGEKYETLHLVWPFMKAIERHLIETENDSPLVRAMKQKGIEYITKIGDDFRPTNCHKLAVFLHPVFKSLQCASEEEKMAIIDSARQSIAAQSDLIFLEQSQQPVESNQSITAHERFEPDPFFMDFIEHEEQEDESGIGTTNSCEIENYIDFKIQPKVRSLNYDLFMRSELTLI